MGSIANTARAVDALAGVTAECRGLAEYEQARHDWLSHHIGFDASYIGAAIPDAPMEPKISGCSARRVAHCESQIDRYRADLSALNGAAERAGGAVHDLDALSARARDRMPFYREVVSGLGIRATAVSLFKAQGKTLGCLYLGRTARGAHFGAELDLLRRVLPVLSLGRRLFELAPGPLVFARAPEGALRPEPEAVAHAAVVPSSFTRRERQILALLAQGLTNRQIATQLGSSPFTVKNQIAAMLAKSDLASRTALACLSLRAGRA